jgi:hypothetical protein
MTNGYRNQMFARPNGPIQYHRNRVNDCRRISATTEMQEWNGGTKRHEDPKRRGTLHQARCQKV